MSSFCAFGLNVSDPLLTFTSVLSAKSSWIRDPKYSFFVPDTLIQRYTPKTQSMSRSLASSYADKYRDPYCPPEYTGKFVEKLIKREGILFSTLYFSHLEKLKKKSCRVKEQVEELLEKAGKLKDLAECSDGERKRMSYEEDEDSEDEDSEDEDGDDDDGDNEKEEDGEYEDSEDED